MNQAILSMLHKIDASNQEFTKRMDELEGQDTISSTLVVSPTSQHPGASHITGIQQNKVNMSVAQASAVTNQLGYPCRVSQCHEYYAHSCQLLCSRHVRGCQKSRPGRKILSGSQVGSHEIYPIHFTSSITTSSKL